MNHEASRRRGLRRFRSVLAEIEKSKGLCPKCDTQLVQSEPDPDEFYVSRANFSYHFCPECEKFYVFRGIDNGNK